MGHETLEQREPSEYNFQLLGIHMSGGRCHVNLTLLIICFITCLARLRVDVRILVIVVVLLALLPLSPF